MLIRAFDRRTVLAGALTAFALPSWAQPVPEEAFETLSVALLGTAAAVPALSFAYQKALRAGPHRELIERMMWLATTLGGPRLLEHIAAEGLMPATDIVVAAWYSGMVDGKLITYADALAWNAVPFTKPNGTCGGAFGYWAEPPTG